VNQFYSAGKWQHSPKISPDQFVGSQRQNGANPFAAIQKAVSDSLVNAGWKRTLRRNNLLQRFVDQLLSLAEKAGQIQSLIALNNVLLLWLFPGKEKGVVVIILIRVPEYCTICLLRLEAPCV